MRLLSAALFLTLSAVGCTAAAAPAPLQVDIPAGDLKLHAQLYKPDGDWTLDEIDQLAPGTILEGLVNPAPPKEA